MNTDTSALLCLTLTIGMTAMLWVPYILHAMIVRGPLEAAGYREDLPALADWAQRAKKAHANAIENLVLFAPLVIVHQMVAGGSEAVTKAAWVYLACRVAHYATYTAKVPLARTVFFLIAWGATVFIAVKTLSALSGGA